MADYRVAKAFKAVGAKPPSVRRVDKGAGVCRHLPSAAMGARPVPRRNFDGKIMNRRVSNLKAAKYGSNNRLAGAMVHKDAKMDATWFHKGMKGEIMPAICGQVH